MTKTNETLPKLEAKRNELASKSNDLGERTVKSREIIAAVESAKKLTHELKANRDRLHASSIAAGHDVEHSTFYVDKEGGAATSKSDLEEEINAASLAEQSAEIQARIHTLALEDLEQLKKENEQQLADIDEQISIKKIPAHKGHSDSLKASHIAEFEKVKAAQHECDKLHKEIKNIAIEKLRGEIFSGLRPIRDELLQELDLELKSLSRVLSKDLPGVRFISTPVKNKFKSDEESTASRDSVYHKLLFQFQRIAPIAEVLSEKLDQRELRFKLFGMLDIIQAKTIDAVRDYGLVPPQWAFDGRSRWQSWVTRDTTQPVIEFLNQNGFELTI